MANELKLQAVHCKEPVNVNGAATGSVIARNGLEMELLPFGIYVRPDDIVIPLANVKWFKVRK